MATNGVILGFLFTLTIGLGAGRPQYNYRSGATGAVPNQSFNTASVNSQPSSYRSGFVQNQNQRLVPEPTRINSYTGLVDIVPSHPLTQSYLPPTQQNSAASQNFLPVSQPSQQIVPPVASASQNFRDVSQLPLQSRPSFTAIPVAPAFNEQSLGGQSSNFNTQASLPQQKAIITKDVYIHTAPQELDDDDRDFRSQLESVPIRRNYRIIFIKAPTQNIRVAAQALRQAQAVNEERTIIYVLSKKADVADLQKQLEQVQGAQTVNRKPEVYFIKYKTNEEALRAQQEIQAQYDALGGSTNISDEGIAPITSVIGGLLGDKLSTSGSGQSGSVAAPNRTYLSPSSSSGSRSVSTPNRRYLPPAKV